MAAGYTLRELMEYMGHSSLQATERYVKLLPQPAGPDGAADRLNAYLAARRGRGADPRCKQSANKCHARERFVALRCGPGGDRKAPKLLQMDDFARISNAGGGTRTPDTRIMIPLL